MGMRALGAGLALAWAVIGVAHGEPMTGGGRVGEVSVAAGLLAVDGAPLRLESATRVFDYAGKAASRSDLEVGMSVSYTARPPDVPGQPPVVQQVRMVPN